MSGSIVLDECAEIFFIQNENGRFGGQARIGNRFRDVSQSTVFGLVHADTSFASGALQALCNAAASGTTVSGIVGINSNAEQVWGNQIAVERSFACGAAARLTGEVSTLDGCSIFFAKTSKVRFDENFDSFHCVVEDATLSAKHELGMNVFVPLTNADHPSLRDNPENWLNDYRKYHAQLTKKWSHISFLTTA